MTIPFNLLQTNYVINVQNPSYTLDNKDLKSYTSSIYDLIT